jgi:diacylglycerol kinase family enzyme
MPTCERRGVTIATEDGRQEVTLDGELCGHTPLEARVADEQLQLVIPASSRAP